MIKHLWICIYEDSEDSLHQNLITKARDFGEAAEVAVAFSSKPMKTMNYVGEVFML